MQIEYSETAGAHTIRLSDREIVETVEIEPDIYAVLDRQGQPVSVEFVVARDFFSFLTRQGRRLDRDMIAALIVQSQRTSRAGANP